MRTDNNTSLNSTQLKPLLKKITESPEEFLQFLGGVIGLGEGLYSSVVANSFTFFSTIKIANNFFGLRLLNTMISIGVRANWYYNLGAGISIIKKFFSLSFEEEQELSISQKFERHLEKLNNKQMGHVIGICLGIYIYLYIMSQLSEKSLNDLFKSADYASTDDLENLGTEIGRNFDQVILIAGGLSNLFSYIGNWMDGITGNRTLFHALSTGMSFIFSKKTQDKNLSIEIKNLEQSTTEINTLEILTL